MRLARPRSITSAAIYTPIRTLGGDPAGGANADSAINVGFQFSVSATCTLTGIYWYQSATGSPDVSSRQAGLWVTADGVTDNGTVVTATAGAPTGTGWQLLPVAGYTLNPGNAYIAAVFHPAAGYTADANFFLSGPGAGVSIGPITIPSASTAVGTRNGTYIYSGGLTMPNTNVNSASYGVDIRVSS